MLRMPEAAVRERRQTCRRPLFGLGHEVQINDGRLGPLCRTDSRPRPNCVPGLGQGALPGLRWCSASRRLPGCRQQLRGESSASSSPVWQVACASTEHIPQRAGCAAASAGQSPVLRGLSSH